MGGNLFVPSYLPAREVEPAQVGWYKGWAQLPMGSSRPAPRVGGSPRRWGPEVGRYRGGAKLPGGLNLFRYGSNFREILMFA